MVYKWRIFQSKSGKAAVHGLVQTAVAKSGKAAVQAGVQTAVVKCGKIGFAGCCARYCCSDNSADIWQIKVQGAVYGALQGSFCAGELCTVLCKMLCGVLCKLTIARTYGLEFVVPNLGIRDCCILIPIFPICKL